MTKAQRIHSSRRRETATTYTFAENAAVLLPRAFEALWLVVAGLVPLLFATPGVMVFVDVPKGGLLRSLTALMAILWVSEWALLARRGSEYPEMTV